MKHWKAILGVVAVFLLGMAAGGLLAVGIVRRQLEGGSPAMARLVERRLSRQLQLDAAQREQLRVIVADAQSQVRNVRQQVRPQVETVLTQAVAKVRTALRPDQQEKFDKLVAESRARWQRFPGNQ